MEFVEPKLFSKKLSSHLADDEYRELQGYMLENPDAGDIIKESGGIRKLRWKAEGRGKLGGMRIIYYLELAESRFLMLTLCAKNEVQDLSKAEVKMLRKIVEEWNNA